jgi:hypothetical protein
MNWQAIQSIGTLLAITIALFATFYPDIKTHFNNPKLEIDVVKTGGESANVLRRLMINVKNIGKNVAHDTVSFIKIMDSSGRVMCANRIPLLRFTETYDPYDLYPQETIEFEAAIRGKVTLNQTYPWFITCYPFGRIPGAEPPLTSRDFTKGEYFVEIAVGCVESGVHKALMKIKILDNDVTTIYYNNKELTLRDNADHHVLT